MVEPLFPIPQNVFDLKGTEFFNFIDDCCGRDIAEYFQLLGVRSAHSLLGINDIFLPLQQDYLELSDAKKKLAFCRSDGSCVIKIGIQHDINKLLKTLQNAQTNNQKMTTAVPDDNYMILTSDVVQQHPFLKHLFDFFSISSDSSHSSDKPFLHHFLQNLLSNLPLVKSRYRYNENVLDFALCLSILAGRNAYEFVRLNLPGALPNLTTIQTKLANEEIRAHEGEFRYHDMEKYMSTTNSKLAFCAEDCTTVTRKIVYDVRSNSFTGFTPPLNENGLPLVKHFQTNSFEELQRWFAEKDVSKLLNLHMIQSISTSNQNSHPFPFAAYGTNGKYTAIDIVRRWFTMFEKSSSYGTRIVGFSTDADSRYLLAMKLVSGFFATLVNDPKKKHPLLFNVTIPISWSWFYLPFDQLFLCMQDSMHICTKLRNRLLSDSAVMMIGNGEVSIDYLLELIASQSKFNHNLIKSDICPRDKQNYKSCEKLCGAIECLKQVNGSYATVIFLTIIRCIIIAFIDTSSTTSQRIYNAWLAVFLCRLWRVWLDLVQRQDLYNRILQMNNISDKAKTKFKKHKTKRIFFIASPSYLCIELNAHHFTYLTLLVSENKLPSETLKVFLFNSQSCENFLRLSRAMSGTFSVSVNYSIQQYLHRQEKISMLYSIKTQTNSSSTNTKLRFPRHHKTQQNYRHSIIQPEKMTKQQIQNQVDRAFKDAFNLLLPLNIKQILKQANLITMNQVNQYMRDRFNKLSIKVDVKIPIPIDEIQSDSDSEESMIEEDEQDQQNEMNSSDDDVDIEDDNEDDVGVGLSSRTNNNRLHSMKGVCDTINPELKDSYFSVNIDGKKKYLHKSTAIWCLTDEKHKLSSDRINRVMDNR